MLADASEYNVRVFAEGKIGGMTEIFSSDVLEKMEKTLEIFKGARFGNLLGFWPFGARKTDPPFPFLPRNDENTHEPEAFSGVSD